MISRRSRVQEKRTAKRAVLLMATSIMLLIAMVFFGIPALARFAAFVGDLRSSSAPILQEDKTPPAPPSVDPLPAYTQDAKLTVSGLAEAGSTLKASNNGKLFAEVVVDDTSSYSIEVNLEPGPNKIAVTATDQAGNESDVSSPYTVIYDIESPLLEITGPQNGQEFFGSEKSITLEGKSEPDVKVTMNDRVAIVDSEGGFSQTVNLSEGENTFLIKARDQAGNETEKTLTVRYTP